MFSRNMVYIDETWVNVGHVPRKEWIDPTGKCTKRRIMGKGGRWIIVDARGPAGFVPGACDISDKKYW